MEIWAICLLTVLCYAEFWYILFVSDKKSELQKKNEEQTTQISALEDHIKWLHREWEYTKGKRDELEEKLQLRVIPGGKK